MPPDVLAVSECTPLPGDGAGPRRQRTLRTLADVAAAIGPVLDALASAGFSERETFGIRLALEEALVNAIKHGHRGDPSKRVRFRCRISAARFLAEVEDEGAGFDPYLVPDPLDPANLDRDSGRGLFLMRHHMTWVRFNAIGNCVTLCKQRVAV